MTHLTPRADFQRHYSALVARLPAGAVVVLLGVPDMGAVPRLDQPLRAIVGLRGRQLDEVVRTVAAEHGAVYVPIADATGPTFRSEPDRAFAGDGYHPSADGYQAWADAVLVELGPALAVP